MNGYSVRAAVLAAIVTAGCSDHQGVTGPRAPDAGPPTVALVELDGTRPAFFIQKADGSSRARVHFTGAADGIPGNSPLVPALTDANILGLRSVKWSPDGSRIAFVATVAFDQAEVVVMNADGSNARVASPNYAYVLGDVDWSPDGNKIAYIMATQPGLRGLEVFVTDIAGAPTVTKVTTNSGFKGLGAALRFASTGTAVWISQVTGDRGAPLYESIGAVRRVELASGAITPVLENISGEVQAVSRTGAWALVVRRKSLVNGVYDSQLVRIPLFGAGPEQLLVDGGELDAARLTSDDGAVVLLRSGSRFTTLGWSGAPETGIRGSGADQLSADVRR